MAVSRREFSKYLLASLGACLPFKVPNVSANTGDASQGLSTRYRDHFLIGTMINEKFLFDPDPGAQALVETEFNALTADNIFKWENIHPLENVWNWAHADRFVEYAISRGMYPVGHPLVWDTQVPEGLFSQQRQSPRNPEKIRELMTQHIDTLVSRYKGEIKAWDVVNEAFEDNGGWVRNNWFNNLGSSYIEAAFSAARSADPGATLIYNDYNLWQKGKRDRVVNLVRDLNGSSGSIDAIGMQGHIGLDYPNLSEFEKSLRAFGDLDVKVHITELDIDVLPRPSASSDTNQSQLDPYRNGLPDSVADALAERYGALFKILIDHRDVIDRVTFWGYSDRDTWRHEFPVSGRVNHPLLFDKNLNKKKAYRSIYNMVD